MEGLLGTRMVYIKTNKCWTNWERGSGREKLVSNADRGSPGEGQLWDRFFFIVLSTSGESMHAV